MTHTKQYIQEWPEIILKSNKEDESMIDGFRNKSCCKYCRALLDGDDIKKGYCAVCETNLD